ncbi:MAG: hypothetical protein AAFU71_08860 [Cyanobacteria bacterium J06632_22]
MMTPFYRKAALRAATPMAIGATLLVSTALTTAAHSDPDIPFATTANDATALHLSWINGQSNTIDIQGWTVAVLESYSCETGQPIAERTLSAQRILGQPVVDEQTGNVAVSILLEECFDTQKSAVFVIDPQGYGGHALYRVQVPGPQPFPHEFSTYALRDGAGVQYWNSTLMVRHGDASGAEAMLLFRPGMNPAGEYAGCATIAAGESGGALCPQ